MKKKKCTFGFLDGSGKKSWWRNSDVEVGFLRYEIF